MNVTIPLVRPAGAPSLRPSINFPLFGAAATGGSGGIAGVDSRRSETVRAVAVAVASARLDLALELLGVLKDNPAIAVASFNKAAKDVLQPVLVAVTTVQDNRARGGTANPRLASACAIVGADPLLAAAAYAAITTGDDQAQQNSAWACLYWVGSIDPVLLERAANAARGQGVDQVPETVTVVADLDKRLRAAEAAATAAKGANDATFNGLRAQLDMIAMAMGAIQSSVLAMQEDHKQLRAQIKTLEDKVDRGTAS